MDPLLEPAGIRVDVFVNGSDIFHENSAVAVGRHSFTELHLPDAINLYRIIGG